MPKNKTVGSKWSDDVLPPYHCRVCGSTFDSLIGLGVHANYRHGENQPDKASAKKIKATLKFTDKPLTGETVTIGNQTFEFRPKSVKREKIDLAAITEVRYCPGCGTHLEEIIRACDAYIEIEYCPHCALDVGAVRIALQEAVKSK